MERELIEKRETKHQMVIESNGVNKTKVFLDGKDLSDTVKEIRFRHKGGEHPMIEMELMGCDISVRSPQVPRLPEALSDFYKPVD